MMDDDRDRLLIYADESPRASPKSVSYEIQLPKRRKSDEPERSRVATTPALYEPPVVDTLVEQFSPLMLVGKIF
jgi:hypothetical protein